MVKSYTFKEKDDFSKRGVEVVTRYLQSLPKTVKVENVENDIVYQQIDIDLIWTYRTEKGMVQHTLEVKTDRYTTGNFFLETVSNKELGTLGCFVKTKADMVYYYFSTWDSLYVIPTKEAQNWFRANLDRFPERPTTTQDSKGRFLHTTIGRLVPIKTMLAELPRIILIKNISSLFNNL